MLRREGVSWLEFPHVAQRAHQNRILEVEVSTQSHVQVLAALAQFQRQVLFSGEDSVCDGLYFGGRCPNQLVIGEDLSSDLASSHRDLPVRGFPCGSQIDEPIPIVPSPLQFLATHVPRCSGSIVCEEHPLGQIGTPVRHAAVGSAPARLLDSTETGSSPSVMKEAQRSVSAAREPATKAWSQFPEGCPRETLAWLLLIHKAGNAPR